MPSPDRKPEFDAIHYFEAVVASMALRKKLMAISRRRKNFSKEVPDEMVLQWARQDLGLTELEIAGYMSFYGIDIDGNWKKPVGFQGGSEEEERAFVEAAYRNNGDNIDATAKELGLSDNALRVRILMLRVFQE
jgi:hypothetical protein